ncbi:hypothetical protein SAMN02799616_02649 [Paenibacillus sp. UNC499MF]|nr:hypothetical protein SAMN02799616_02649 [Paenibacillus sp. UNC499MF]
MPAARQAAASAARASAVARLRTAADAGAAGMPPQAPGVTLGGRSAPAVLRRPSAPQSRSRSRNRDCRFYSVTVTAVPRPGSLSAVMEPPSRKASCLAIAMPSPVPRVVPSVFVPR